MDRRLKKSTILLGFILFFLNIILKNSFAEYRAYQYLIIPKVRENYLSNKSYMIKSTLDPVTYLSYHGGRESISLTLLRTWKCPGHTGHMQDICSSPYQKLQQEMSEAEKINKEKKVNLEKKE